MRLSCFLLGMTFPLLLGFLGCGGSDHTNSSVSGGLVKTSACKGHETPGSAGRSTAAIQDCVEWEWDGRNTLKLRHINAAFNCCPIEIQALVITDGRNVQITETERSGLCSCLCLYDLDYSFQNLQSGAWIFRFKELNMNSSDIPFEVKLELASPDHGLVCVERKHYPWNM